MGMMIDTCANMLMAKEKCMERETIGTDTDCNYHNCDDCSLCYEQGTMGEQKEALKLAVDTMRKYQEQKKDLEAAIEEIKTERDKSYAVDDRGHGWGLQSAFEILQKHLGEEYEGY